MGTPQPLEILKMDRRAGTSLTRRAVLEESRAEQRGELIAGLKEGQVLNGVVKNIATMALSLTSAVWMVVACHRHRLATD